MHRILIIEDDNSIAALEQDYLEIEGFEVVIASDGETGLEAISRQNFNLILLDLMLPNISGFELCKKIRKNSDIPILMVTAKDEDIDKVRGLGLGADDYIVKPFSPSELVARVKAHLARYERLIKTNDTTEDIHKGELRINIASRQVFIHEKEVPFTTREFDLLTFLAKHPNQVFSKEHLFEKIWGIESMGDTATVTVHVKKIRKKIEKDTANPQFIQTVWGSGYRFKANHSIA
ncbi:DNA-binding response OmpR family regulator [Virgibacillus litoralis]|uniref:DNA-binding response OmpR family regulator n=2 Tax=Virgibacillus litoralis TaxID=578221 RepID=A0ABS4HDS9_9BACI|nr:response regulator transcription factor [Virgibacillus litoralis]MBP1949074.1 DNA-binding response OmpR family regulator [Virgibacillus litoralis]